MTCDPAESAEMSRFWTFEQDCSVGMEEAPDDTNYYKKFTRSCPDSTTNTPIAGKLCCICLCYFFGKSLPNNTIRLNSWSKMRIFA